MKKSPTQASLWSLTTPPFGPLPRPKTTAIALNIDSGFEMLEQNKAIKDGISEKTFASSMGLGFMNFYGIQTVSDFWAWSQGPFLELVAANTFPDKPGFFGR
jgi:hypothetical protein